MWWLAFALILILGGVLRWRGLNFGLPYQLHPDEPSYYLFGRLVRTDGTAAGLGGATYPPGYLYIQAILQFITLTATEGQIAQSDYFFMMRCLSAALNLASVTLIALLTGNLMGGGAGLLAGLFLAVNPEFVSNARFGTPDNPHVFFTLLAIYLGHLGYRTGESRRLGWSLVSAFLAILMKYQAAPVLAAPFLFALLAPMNRRERVKWLALAGVFTLALFAFLFNPAKIRRWAEWPASPFPSDLARPNLLAPGSLDEYGSEVNRSLGGAAFWIVAGVGVVLMLVAAVRSRKWDWPRPIVLAVYAGAFYYGLSLFWYNGLRQALPLVAVGGLLWGASVAAIAGAVAGAVGWGAERLRPALAASGALAVRAASASLAALALCGLIVAPLRATIRRGSELQMKDTRALVADWFKSNAPAGPIAIEYDGVQFMRDYGGYRGEKDFPLKVVTSLFELTPEDLEKDGIHYLVADERAGARGGYYSDPTNAEFSSRVVRLLSLENVNLQGPRLTVFRLGAIRHRIEVSLGGLVLLEGYDVNPSTPRPGGALRLTLYWRRLGPIATDYTVFTHVLDAQGNLVAGKDNPPAGGARPTTTWTLDGETIVDDYVILLPPTLAAGIYTLEIGMYDPISGERLMPDTPEGASSLVLGEIEIR